VHADGGSAQSVLSQAATCCLWNGALALACVLYCKRMCGGALSLRDSLLGVD
jgi:hypothetical protein